MYGPYYYHARTASPPGSYAGGTAASTFDLDAVTTPAADSSNAVYSWTHTPVGTPDYVVVAVGVNGNSGADSISGVTYGGSAMTRVPTDGFAQDTSEEVGSVYLYTLASPSSGAQTVAVTKTSAAIYAIAASYTLAGATGTPTIAASDHEDENGDTPYSAYDAAGDTGVAFGVVFSGHGTVGSLTDYGDTVRDGATAYISQVIAFAHTPNTTGATSVGFTQSWNDLAWSSAFITDPGP